MNGHARLWAAVAAAVTVAGCTATGDASEPTAEQYAVPPTAGRASA